MKQLSLCLFLLTSVVALGQTKIMQGRTKAPGEQQSPAPERDGSALTTIQTALAAMGGDGWTSITDSESTGAIAPVDGSPVKPATFDFKISGGEFRYETITDSGQGIFASGHGQPAFSRGGKVNPLPFHVSMGAPPLFQPAVVLAARLTDPSYSLIDAGTVEVLGRKAFAVKSSNNANQPVSDITLQTWYFDISTGLCLRVESRLPDGFDMGSWTEAATDFSDFKQVGGLMVPFTMTNYEGGKAVAVVSLSTVQFNVGIDPSQFDLVGGAK